jgi:hypothetical protein
MRIITTGGAIAAIRDLLAESAALVTKNYSRLGTIVCLLLYDFGKIVKGTLRRARGGPGRLISWLGGR